MRICDVDLHVKLRLKLYRMFGKVLFLCVFVFNSKMASAKRACMEVEGYIHEVSAVLQSGSGSARYFTAVLQEADKNSRIVVFDPQRHNIFQCAERDR